MVAWCALTVAAISGGLLAIDGIGEEGLRAVIRVTARTSLVLFVSAFTASALRELWPAALTRWLLVNRRYLGVSFAVSHFTHLFFILALANTSPAFVASLRVSTVVGGGLAYVFIAAMTATSFDRTAAWLGPHAWRTLHTAGAYYIWFIFFISYAPRAMQSIWYAPFVVVLVVAVGARQLARRHRRAAVPEPVPTGWRRSDASISD